MLKRLLLIGILLPVCGGRAFNVKDCGAVGDGGTDDAAAIRRALNHIAGQVRHERFRQEDGWCRGSTETPVDKLYFPAGVYVISRTLFADGSVALRGGNAAGRFCA